MKKEIFSFKTGKTAVSIGWFHSVFENTGNILFLAIKDGSVRCKMCFRYKNWKRSKM